jgi:hypothetical protein
MDKQMNAYELADELDKVLKAIGLEDSRVPTMLRQQAEKISNMEIWEKKYLDRIEELENQLDKYSHYEAMTHQEYMKQITELEQEKIRAYDNGYEDGKKALQKQADRIAKLEQALQSIANERVELSNDKIKWQCEDHIRWAKEALK